jgi:hypothetical protein
LASVRIQRFTFWQTHIQTQILAKQAALRYLAKQHSMAAQEQKATAHRIAHLIEVFEPAYGGQTDVLVTVHLFQFRSQTVKQPAAGL